MQQDVHYGSPEATSLSVLALGRNSLAYAFGGLAYKGVALLTVPILARVLSPAQLGLLDLAAVFATLLGLAAGLGTEQGVAFFEARTNRGGEVWSSAVALVGALSAAVGAGCLIFQEPIAVLITGDLRDHAVIAAAGLYAGVMAVSAFALNTVRLRGSPRAYAVISFALFTAELGAALIVAVFISEPVVWMVLAWALGALLVVTPVLVRYLPRLSRPRWTTMSAFIRFGAPLVPVAIAWLVGDTWMRTALARDVGLASLGEYGIAYRLTSVLGLIVSGFGVAWHPYIYRTPAADVGRRFVSAAPSLVLAVGVVGIGLTALAPEVVIIAAGPAYANAGVALPALSGGMVALATFVLLSAVVSRSGSTRKVGVAAIVGMFVQVGLASMLIEPLGVVGASLASLGGYVTAAALLLATQRRLVLGRSGLGLGIATAATASGLVVAAQAMTQPLALRIIVFAGFAALAGLIGRRLRT